MKIETEKGMPSCLGILLPDEYETEDQNDDYEVEEETLKPSIAGVDNLIISEDSGAGEALIDRRTRYKDEESL